MPAKNIRESFLKFFAERGHKIRSSAPLIPQDPSLLFNSAGMVPFKNYFLGKSKDLTRAASVQLCLRTTDIERVGLTLRHLTFFEMLGNFSFGDYFKKETIAWAWEFLTSPQWLALPKERLFVTIFREDDEACNMWSTLIPSSKIKRLGEDSNFWTMGPTGPCGPCSEIYWDRGAGHSCDALDCAPGCDRCERFIEIWNLVFTQFDRQENGTLMPLAQKNIDTGMGLERLAAVLEEKESFQTSLFAPLAKNLEQLLGKSYQESPKTFRIIMDHCRAAWFLLAEGILPSNVERGYVLRRLIRRAAKEAKLHGLTGLVLTRLKEPLKEIFQDIYPDYCAKFDFVGTILREEEEGFERTLTTGLSYLQDAIASAKKAQKTSISGVEAFQLYDTYGFPLEMTEEKLKEEGLGLINHHEFEEAKLKAKEISQRSWKGSKTTAAVNYEEIKNRLGLKTTTFLGYENLRSQSPVIALLDPEGLPIEKLNNGEEGFAILTETPFYPEGGGQIGDQGSLTWEKTQAPNGSEGGVAQVIDTQSPLEGLIVHQIKILSGVLPTGAMVSAEVLQGFRLQTARHHTATHLLHWALRKLLGPQVIQAGSRVAPEKLRFDFTYPKSLKGQPLQDIELLVKEQIAKDVKRERQEMTLDAAKNAGAMTLFNEKYRNKIFVVRFGESLEACGGTHVLSTKEIGAFKILKESSVAAGVRRIEAAAGDALDLREDTTQNNVPAAKEKPRGVLAAIEGKILEGRSSSGLAFKIKYFEQATTQHLRSAADQDKLDFNGVSLIAAPQEGKTNIIICLHSGLLPKGPKAPLIFQQVAKEFGGKGGGRPDFAQGSLNGRPNVEQLKKALLSALP